MFPTGEPPLDSMGRDRTHESTTIVALFLDNLIRWSHVGIQYAMQPGCWIGLQAALGWFILTPLHTRLRRCDVDVDLGAEYRA